MKVKLSDLGAGSNDPDTIKRIMAISFQNIIEYYIQCIKSDKGEKESSRLTIGKMVTFIDDVMKNNPTDDDIDRVVTSMENIFSSIEKKEYPKLNYKTYLMKDSNTGYTKIGRSVNPKKRESTLQSEKPTINMFAVCENDHESILHKKYSKKRIRGEWFNLSDKNLSSIINNYNFT